MNVLCCARLLWLAANRCWFHSFVTYHAKHTHSITAQTRSLCSSHVSLRSDHVPTTYKPLQRLFGTRLRPLHQRVLALLFWFVHQCGWCVQICPNGSHQIGKETRVRDNQTKQRRFENALKCCHDNSFPETSCQIATSGTGEVQIRCPTLLSIILLIWPSVAEVHEVLSVPLSFMLTLLLR